MLRPMIIEVDGYRTWGSTSRYIIFKINPSYTSFIFTFRDRWKEKYPDYERADLADLRIWEDKYFFTVRRLPLECEVMRTEDPDLFKDERNHALRTENDIWNIVSLYMLNTDVKEAPKDDSEAYERYRYLEGIHMVE